MSAGTSATHGATFYCVLMLGPRGIHNNESIKQQTVPDVHSLWTWPHKG